MHLRDECNYQFAIDHFCIRPTEPHSDRCLDHYETDDLRWHLGHPIADCCQECCGGAEHYDEEGEVIAA